VSSIPREPEYSVERCAPLLYMCEGFPHWVFMSRVTGLQKAVDVAAGLKALYPDNPFRVVRL
jgi:hypothetical protein